jgi:formylglycine-generating enzyme required for sulfatase activity
VAWFTETVKAEPAGSQATQPAGGKSPIDSLGIYDMSGNIMEWCWDWFDSGYYGRSGIQNPDVDPRGPSSGDQRVRRGGSWSNAANSIRVSVRNNFPPSNSTWVMGFRVVRGPENPPDRY